MSLVGQATEVVNQIDSSVIRTSDVCRGGLHRSVLRDLTEAGLLWKYSHGVYARSGELEDEYYLLQKKYSRGIFSHGQALFFWGYSDRVPFQYIMTFPRGYHSASFVDDNVCAHYVGGANYELGVTEVESSFGNPLRVYNIERTLCDVLRGNQGDVDIIHMAIRRYLNSSDKRIVTLLQYAEALRVKPKVMKYLEVLG